MGDSKKMVKLQTWVSYAGGSAKPDGIEEPAVLIILTKQSQQVTLLPLSLGN